MSTKDIQNTVLAIIRSKRPKAHITPETDVYDELKLTKDDMRDIERQLATHYHLNGLSNVITGHTTAHGIAIRLQMKIQQERQSRATEPLFTFEASAA